MEAIGRATHHIHVNGERLVLARAPREGEAPSLDEDGAGEPAKPSLFVKHSGRRKRR